MDKERRDSLARLASYSLALGMIASAAESTSKDEYENINPDYVDSEKMFLPKSQMSLKKDSLALVIVNPQIDFLSPKGVGWNIYGESIKEHRTSENILSLVRAAKALQIPTFVSYCVWNAQDFKVMLQTPINNFIKGTKLCYGKGEGLNANDISNSGANFLPELEPFILDNKTILTTPRKGFGLNGSDLIAKLRMQNIKQVILCGMDANVHVDSHLRDLLAQGFEVGVVRDATAGAKLPEGDGYLAALINFRFLANEVFFTKEIIGRMQS